jgi:hypothetical protein
VVILLPGIQAGPPELAPLAARLRGDVRVLPLPDLEVDTLPALAAALAATLPPGRHDVVAASFGGLLAWALPAERVRSLVTIGTLPWRTPAAARSGRAGHLLPWVPETGWRRLYRARVRRSLLDDGADDTLLAAVRPPARRVLAARLRAIGGWALPPRPPVRAAWLWGATDPFVTWDVDGVRAAGHEPHVVPGGHRPHVSHPSEVARWVEGWAARGE